MLKCVYINSDGGSWIRSASSFIYKSKHTAAQKETRRYAERLHATLSEHAAVRKILAIREQIGNI